MSDPTERVVSLQPTGGTFDFKQAPPFALSYLKTYYMQPPTADEVAVSKFLIREFAKRVPTGRFIELGCGPTLHHVFPFAPHVKEVHLADYLEDNLEQLRLWKAASPRAHDWSQYAAMTLRHEGLEDSPNAVAERQRLARERIAEILHCDLKQDTPHDRRGQYDGVGCFYCTEEIGISLPEWRRVLANAAAYLRPGGTLYMACLAEMDHYTVRDSSGTEFAYPCANLRPDDVSGALADLGFKSGATTIEITKIEHPDCGLTAALVIAAQAGSSMQGRLPMQ